METYTEFLSGLVYHAFKLLTIATLLFLLWVMGYFIHKGFHALFPAKIKKKVIKQETYPHTCVCCTGPFNKGGIIQDDKFCKSCLDNYRHFDYYHDQGISDKQVYEITEEQTDL